MHENISGYSRKETLAFNDDYELNVYALSNVLKTVINRQKL